VDDADRLRASRARLAAARIGERRRYERALHDGVQQDLVALAVRLQLAQELVDDPTAANALEQLRREVHEALDGVRRLADEIYPSGLDTWGLRDTLLRLTPRVRAEGVGRQRPELEAAIVFACRAAAEVGGDVSIDLAEDGDELRVELAGARVTDELADLVGAAGGSLTADATGLVVATFPRQSADAR
jgi:hypothetical protein